jgi:YGGT family
MLFQSLIQSEGVEMSENLPVGTGSVDRREEVVTTQQPGYATTERVTYDAAAANRIRVYRMNRIIWSILGLLEILLGLRFMLKLIAANPDSGFGSFIYAVTGIFVAPFSNLLSTWSSGAMVLEVSTLIAMMVYAMFFWGVVYVLRIVMDRSSARTVSRTTREISPDGVQRTTHTDSKR